MWITLEGNIGVGKSTLISRLAEYLDWEHLDERVESDPEFQDLLERYYKDNFVSYELQTWLTQRRFDDIQSLNPKKDYLVERSIFGDIVFTYVNHQLGNITQENYKKYTDFAYNCLRNIKLPRMIIYLDAKPSVCFQRTMFRNRECEQGITEEYLKYIGYAYRTLMYDIADEYEVPVYTIPYDEFLSVDEVIKQCWIQSL